MTNHGFHQFKHILKLTDEATDGILDGTVYVLPKLDGSNGSVWSDGTDVYCGSRKREVNLDKDNAGFYQYVAKSNSENIPCLREFCRNNPNLIVYGEWLRGVCGAGYIGNIKAYRDGGFWVFAVYDRDSMAYLDYPTYTAMLKEAGYNKVIPAMAIFENPTINELNALLDENHYNLPDNVYGEGVVIWNYDFVSKFGNFEVGKIVRADFNASKSKSKQVLFEGDIEDFLVKSLLSDEEIFKSRMKAEVHFGEEFNNKSGKHIGYILADVWSSYLEDNVRYIAKKYGKYAITFSKLQSLVNDRVRTVLGIGA